MSVDIPDGQMTADMDCLFCGRKNDMDILSSMIESEKIENAYEGWQTYREEVTAFIVSEFVTKEKHAASRKGDLTQETRLAAPTLGIWGAGRADDIDLKILSKYFRLVLIDRDKEALTDAVKKYGLSEDEVICGDIPFWGITYSDYEMFEALLKECEDVDGISQFLADIIHKNSHGTGTFNDAFLDYSVCIGIHSQLNVRFAGLLYAYRNNYTQDELLVLQKQLRQLNDYSVKRLNDIIYFMTKRKIIWGYELAAVTCVEEWMLDVNRNDFTDGIEGARELEKDIGFHNEGDIVILEEKRYVWPFAWKDEKKNYIMQLVSAEKILE